MASPEEAAQTMIDNLPEKTGKSLKQWMTVLSKEPFVQHGEIVKWLKADQGITHGFANLIAHKFRAQSNENEIDEDPEEALFKGKENLLTIYKQLKAGIESMEADVEFSFKKSYLSLRSPKKQFAIIQPSTKTRLDLGLNLKGVAPSGILETSGSFNAMVSHRIKLTNDKEVTDEVFSHIYEAYQAAL